ncbi:MAG: ATP-binding protein [Actinomycetota bacterium]
MSTWTYGTATVDECDLDLVPGDVVLIEDADSQPNLAQVHRDVWPDEPWVGVVRLRLPDVTVIDIGGRPRRVPTNDLVEYREGNTVEAGDFVGVIRVLSDEPIKYIDLPAVDDVAIRRFHTAPETAGGLSFDDFGGLTDVVDRARTLVELPLLRHDSLSKIGARPIKGVLFTGPPGTGKTLLARIIAAESKSDYYEISGPEFFSKWYGQSEEVLRRIFESAANHPRAILFFDEIDSVASKRGDDSHEASRRIVAQLLTLMDGFAKADANVVVIATTNRPQDLDPALLRPGRFDWEIRFPMPDQADRLDILLKSARDLSIEQHLPHALIADKTEGWSAAELALIWSEAALLAVQDEREQIMVEDYVGGFERVKERKQQATGSSWGVEAQ